MAPRCPSCCQETVEPPRLWMDRRSASLPWRKFTSAKSSLLPSLIPLFLCTSPTWPPQCSHRSRPHHRHLQVYDQGYDTWQPLTTAENKNPNDPKKREVASLTLPSLHTTQKAQQMNVTRFVIGVCAVDLLILLLCQFLRKRSAKSEAECTCCVLTVRVLQNCPPARRSRWCTVEPAEVQENGMFTHYLCGSLTHS